jgi:hypothetical protein
MIYSAVAFRRHLLAGNGQCPKVATRARKPKVRHARLIQTYIYFTAMVNLNSRATTN